ncbi:ABC transporter ATP-binding protein [Peptoniphilus phoceensis]|uniref:ABC transporter ATP-binding protein n=1 Tax=Peptoniphilus phoceensis TaxID=1720298 RepID=UPI0007832079|nr:ABC transporter ATP-binding protein [Peptoniphilus phoceensis]
MKDFLNIINIIHEYGNIKKKTIILSVFISMFIALLNSAPVKLIQNIMDEGFVKKNYELIVIISILLIVIYFLRSILSYFLNKTSLKISKQLAQDLRESSFELILNSDYETYSRYDSSYINHRINEIATLGDIFSPNIFNIVTTTLEASFVFLLLFRINIFLLMISLIPIPILFLLIKNKNNKLEESTKELMEKMSRQTQRVTEKLSGIEYIQKTGKEGTEINSMKSIDREVFNQKYHQGLLTKKITETISLYVTILPVLLYMIGGYLYINGNITLGGIISFTTNISKVYSPFLNVALFTVNIKSIKASGRRMIELLEEFKNEDDLRVSNENDKICLDEINKIEFINVYFKYKSSSNVIIQNINFDLSKGDVMKISGENGSGKSTLLKLVLGILSPTRGNIKIDSLKYENLDKNAVRKKIGIIDQSIFLFNDTIENNILYALNEKPSRDEFVNIIKLLRLDRNYSEKDIMEKRIGQNGRNLSGGERQKVALARVLLRDNDVIIFDESIANVDYETRNVVKEIINNELNNKIVIVIDHNNFFDDIVTKSILLKNEYKGS